MLELDLLAVEMLNIQIENRKGLSQYGLTDTSMLSAYCQFVLTTGAQTARLNTKISDRMELPTPNGTAVARIKRDTGEYELTIRSPNGETTVMLSAIPVGVQGIQLTSQSILMWYTTAIKSRIDEVPLGPSDTQNVGELFRRLDSYTDPIEGYIDSDGHIRISLIVDTPGLVLRDSQIWFTDANIMEFDLTGKSEDKYALHVVLDFALGIINIFGMQVNALQRRFLLLCSWALSPIGEAQDTQIIQRLMTEYNIPNGFRVGDGIE